MALACAYFCYFPQARLFEAYEVPLLQAQGRKTSRVPNKIMEIM